MGHHSQEFSCWAGSRICGKPHLRDCMVPAKNVSSPIIVISSPNFQPHPEGNMEQFLSKHRTRTLSVAILLLICVTHCGVSGEKPREKPSTAAPVIQDVDGFTIRVVRLTGGSYGYEIRKGPEILVRQKRNPFTGSEAGLSGREDAMKTATWFTRTVLKKEEMLPQHKRLPARILSTRSIPRAIARELHISID